MIETSVVTSGKGDDKLPVVLIHPVFLLVNNCSLLCSDWSIPVDVDFVGLEHIGVHGGHDVMEQIWLDAEQLLGGLSFNQSKVRIDCVNHSEVSITCINQIRAQYLLTFSAF